MTVLSVLCITFLVGCLYAVALAACERGQRFQGPPFTIGQVIVGVVIIQGGMAMATFGGAIATAREAYWLLLGCTALVGAPITAWYAISVDKRFEDLADKLAEE